MNNKFLFTAFLADKKVFNLAEAYWRRLVSAVAEEAEVDFYSYLNHYDAQGRKEYDPNPIFDAYFPRLRKAVRIIQEEPEPGAPDIGAWVDEIELKEDTAPVPELVIALALSRETAATDRELIRKWVGEEVARREMEKVIGDLSE